MIDIEQPETGEDLIFMLVSPIIIAIFLLIAGMVVVIDGLAADNGEEP